MKTFKQHIKEYKGYAGDGAGIGTTGYQNPIEDGSVGDREYLKPEAALADLAEKLGRIGIIFKEKIDITGKSGTFSTGLTQHGGRFGKDIDGSDINDDGIEHKLGRELKLQGKYETLENGSVRVYAKLA